MNDAGKQHKTVIEAEAFVNGAFAYIWLPESMEHIEDSAFSGCNQLRYAYIPNSVSYIHPDAFTGSEQLTIICSQDSYAKSFAIENKIPYLIATGELPS